MAVIDFSKANTDQTKSNGKVQKNEDILFEMGNLLVQAQALTAMTWGEPGETFRAQDDRIQDGFMWTLDSLVARIAALHGQLEEHGAITSPRQPSRGSTGRQTSS